MWLRDALAHHWPIEIIWWVIFDWVYLIAPKSNIQCLSEFSPVPIGQLFCQILDSIPIFRQTHTCNRGVSTGVHEEWECSTLDYRNWAVFMVAHEISHSLFEASFMVRLARQVVSPDWRVNPHDLLVKSRVWCFKNHAAGKTSLVSRSKNAHTWSIFIIFIMFRIQSWELNQGESFDSMNVWEFPELSDFPRWIQQLQPWKVPAATEV